MSYEEKKRKLAVKHHEGGIAFTSHHELEKTSKGQPRKKNGKLVRTGKRIFGGYDKGVSVNPSDIPF